MVVASKCPEDESGNFLEVLEEVLYFLLAKRGVATISKMGGGLEDPTDLLLRFGAEKVTKRPPSSTVYLAKVLKKHRGHLRRQ